MTAKAQLPTSSRRRFIGLSAASLAVLAVPGCASYEGTSFTEAIRRLLTLSSQNAFERLLAPGGFYDTQLAQLQMEELLGTARGGAVGQILGSSIVRDRLLRELYVVAADGAAAAAPVVADTVRVIGIQNALDLVRGDPGAATAFLRANMGQRLIEVMLPEVTEALRIIDDPVIGPALSGLAGVDLRTVAGTIGQRVEDAIWTQIAREEAEIRADPRSTNDPLLIGVFGALR